MELRALKDKATEAFTKGRFFKAAELYEDYCRADPKDHQSRLRMGDAWSKAGQKDRAVTAYQSAAEGFAKEGFLPRAIAASKLILELDPAHQGVQQMLADLYARRGTPTTSRVKPKEGGLATPPGTPSLVAQREVASTASDAARSTAKDVTSGVVPAASAEATSRTPPAPLEAGGAALDLSDSLPPELALTATPSTEARSTPVHEDTEVVLSVEVEVEPQHDEPGWDLTPEDASEPEPASAAQAAGASSDTATNSTQAANVLSAGSAASFSTAPSQSAPTSTSAGAIPPASSTAQAAAVNPISVPSAPTPPSATQGRTPPGLSVRVAPPRAASSPPSMPELPQHRTPSGRWQALASPITGTETPAVPPPAAAAPKPSAPPGMQQRVRFDLQLREAGDAQG
ncbi:MAG: hypothetical protein EOO71_34660, partial [Myxococcaceae bacterium]